MNTILSQMAYSIDATEKLLDVGKTTVYKAINEGKLKAVKYGRRTLIPRESLENFIKQLPSISK